MTSIKSNDHLRKARLSRGWTQADLAESLGVNSLTVGRWERGDTFPTRQNIIELSRLFEMTSEELGFLSEDIQEPSTTNSFLFDPLIPSFSSHQQVIGRKDLFEIIQQRLSTRSTTIGLYGLPGVGKTTIALEIVSRPEIQSLYPDGILWAGLGPHPNGIEIVSRWAELLGIAANGIGTSKSLEARARLLREVIGTRRMLIIFDDLWDESHALDLKVGGPLCSYLITTRFPSIAVNLAGQEAIAVLELTEEDGITLLQQMAPKILESDAEIGRTLVRSVGALPLALTLAGRYLRAQGYHGQPRRIQAAIEYLLDPIQRFHVSEPVGPADAHPSLSPGTSLTLESVIAVSDHHLDEQSQRGLRALSAFPAKPNTFSKEAALAVTAAPVEVLDTLIDVGLLQLDARGRYTLHQTITDYARSQSQSTNKDAEKRFVEYYVNYIAEHTIDEDIEHDKSNVLAMLDLAYRRGMHAQFLHGICAFAPFLLQKGLYDLARSHLTRAYEAAQGDALQQDIITCLHYLGMVLMKQGEYQLATEYYQKGLELARSVGIPEQICRFLSDLGWVTAKRGLFDQAYAYAQEGLNNHINALDSRCRLLTVLGVVEDNKGEFVQAEVHYRKALNIARRIKDKDQLCIILNDLGVNASERGMWTEAFDYYQEMRQIAVQLRHYEWQCLSYLNLCAYHTVNAEYDLASPYNEEALLLARRLGQREWESFALITQGALALRGRKNYEQAGVSLQAALTLATEIESQHFACEALKFLGDLALECQRVDEAADYYAQLKRAIPDGQQALNAEHLYRVGLVAATRREILEAENSGKAALVIFEEIGHRSADEVRQWVVMGCPPSLPTSL